MSSFSFSTCRTVLSGLGASSSRLGSVLASDLGVSRHGAAVMLVTDPGVRAAGLCDGAVRSIEDAGMKAEIFDQTQADPPESCVLSARDAAAACGAEAIVGLGGGSSLDVAKVVAFLAGETTQTLKDMYGVDRCKGKRLPLVQIPTTAGTGSEVTPIAILTTGENAKMGIVSPALHADVAILDAELTISVPPKVTAATGIDAMVHAIEASTSRTLKNGISDLFAREALSLLSSNIRRVCENGNDADARQDMLLGSTYAGMAFANAPVAAVHALAYPIGSHFKVPHGLSNAIMLPHVLRFNADDPKAAAIYSELCDICFPNSARWPSDLHGAHALADGFATLAADLEIPTSLTQVGISENDIDVLAVEALKQERLLPHNPVPVRLQDAVDLYRRAYE